MESAGRARVAGRGWCVRGFVVIVRNGVPTCVCGWLTIGRDPSHEPTIYIINIQDGKHTIGEWRSMVTYTLDKCGYDQEMSHFENELLEGPKQVRLVP